MGRRPKNATNNPESFNDPTSLTSPDLTQPNSVTLSNLAVNLRSQSATIRQSERLKNSALAMEIAPVLHEIRSESEKEDEQRNLVPNSVTPSNLAVNVKSQSAIIWQSERLKNSALAMEIAPVLHEIRSESEKEDEQRIQVEETVQEPFIAEKSLEEKINELLHLLESQKRTSESAKDKVTGTANELRYKALYIESQKKLEDLTAANNELHNKLDVALGKLEVYEKGTHTFSELLGKAKDMMLISNLTRVTEAALNLSSPHAGISSADMATKEGATGAKRKKRANESN